MCSVCAAYVQRMCSVTKYLAFDLQGMCTVYAAYVQRMCNVCAAYVQRICSVCDIVCDIVCFRAVNHEL